MTTPYEPIMRHEWGPSAVICGPCMTQMPSEPCGSKWCTCSCNRGGVTAVPRWVDPPAKVRTEDDFPEFRKTEQEEVYTEFVDLSPEQVERRDEVVRRLAKQMDLPVDTVDSQQRRDVLDMEEPIDIQWHGGKAVPFAAGAAIGVGAAGFWESGFLIPSAMLVLGTALIILGVRIRRGRA